MFKSSIATLIQMHQNVFEDVNRDFDNLKDPADYSMLNYSKILDDMCEYLSGYFKYSESGDTKYADKLFQSTHKFYDEMFTNDKYRRNVSLSEIKSITEDFLAGTKKLQNMLERDYSSTEMEGMCKMSDNQYRKLIKVFTDDVKIYRYLASRHNKLFRSSIDPQLYNAFLDESTPVIHKK